MEDIDSIKMSCDAEQNKKKDIEIHEDLTTSDKNLPSTSKCGTCDYTSDNETDLEVHKEKHISICDVFEFLCSKCDYETNDKKDMNPNIRYILAKYAN